MIQVLQKLIDSLIARAKRTPHFHLQGYMERYWLFRIGGKNKGEPGVGNHPLLAARIHHILRSDEDRGYHDHPWPYVTIILRGGYTEVTPVFDRSGIYIGARRRWYGPGSVLMRRAKSWHRLVLPDGMTTWTLFITGPKLQEWGFMLKPEQNKIHRSQYSATLRAVADQGDAIQK